MSTNTYKKIFTKGPESALPGAYEEDIIRFTTDTGRLFVDNSNSRTEVTDFVRGLTEVEIKAQFAPITSKVYIASDTHRFLIYDTDNDNWVNIAVVDSDTENIIVDIQRIDYDFIATRINGSTFSFTNNGVRTISEGATNGTINVNTNGTTADVAVHGLQALAYKASLSKSDVGLGNVANLDQSKAIKSITRSGTTFTATAIDGSTFSFTQQDNNTTYTGTNGISLSGTTFSNSGVRSIATGTSNGTINVNTNGSTANIAVKGLGDLAYKSSLSKSDVGLSNVANLDQSKAIKSITRSGTTFTATAVDGTTSSFTQQDNNTTYAAGTGIALNSGTFSNSGVRSIAAGTSNGTINVNTNGTTANVAVKGLGSAAYTESSAYAPASHTHSYLPLSGGTMSGQIKLATSGFRTANDSGYNIDEYGNFTALNNSTTGYFCINSNGGVANVKVYWNNGNIITNGTITASSFSGSIANATGLTKSQVTTALGYTPPTTNTTYTGSNGITLSGTNFTNSGVRSIVTGTTNGTINVNTNGGTADVAVKGLGDRAFDSTSYLPLAGGTLTGALNTANNTYNKMGDDVAIGDINVGGILGIKGLNGNTGIRFVPYSGSSAQTISINGSGTMTITGTVNADVLKQNGTAVSLDGHTHSYLPLSGGTLTGSLKIGNSSTASLPTAGLTVHDVRGATISSNCLNRSVNFFFTSKNSPYSDWCSIMHVQGWNGTESYNSWELAGPASTGDESGKPLYIRTSNGTSWGGWRQIYDSSNKPGNNIVYNDSDIPEGAANLSTTANAHKITTYRNGFTIPYQMDNTNDGGMIRCRGTSESNCIFEMSTWDDSGSGETIQFNYYPTTSQVTPTYSVEVPKKSGTIALTSDLQGLPSTASGNTISFTGVPNDCLLRYIMMNTAPNFEDVYIIIRSGSVSAIRTESSSSYIASYSYSNGTLSITTEMSYPGNRYYSLQLISQNKI